MTGTSHFLDGARAAGDYLTSLANTNGNEISWPNVDALTGETKADCNNLYIGISGIALFFLELYKQTGHKPYLQVARRAMLTAAGRETAQPGSPAFVTGRLGVAYGLAVLYKVTGRRTYLRQALELAKACRHPSPGIPHEFINGNAGALLAFLHLHAISQEGWLLEAINEYAGLLIQQAQPAAAGMCWDRHRSHSQSLCGFSHGTAGIGFVFLELGHYLKNPAYYTVAGQAFAYEENHFNPADNNWPDFRLNMWKPEDVIAMEEAYEKGDWKPFEVVGNMAAWCHGAPGIALSRARGYQLTRQRTYLHDLNRALAKTKATFLRSQCLCHGQAGNIEAYIETYTTLNRRRPWTAAQAAGRQLLQDMESLLSRMQADETFARRQVLGLFTGLAGVGYGLLRLHDPFRTTSILAPRLTTVIARKPVAKLHFLSLNRQSLQARLGETWRSKDPQVQEVKRHMAAHYPNNTKLYIKARLLHRKASSIAQLSDDQLLDSLLQLEEDCVLLSASTGQPLFLRYMVRAIEERDISPFCYVVLAAFQQPRTVREVVTLIKKHYNGLQDVQPELLQAKVLEQVREALQGVLLIGSGDADMAS